MIPHDPPSHAVIRFAQQGVLESCTWAYPHLKYIQQTNRQRAGASSFQNYRPPTLMMSVAKCLNLGSTPFGDSRRGGHRHAKMENRCGNHLPAILDPDRGLELTPFAPLRRRFYLCLERLRRITFYSPGEYNTGVNFHSVSAIPRSWAASSLRSGAETCPLGIVILTIWSMNQALARAKQRKGTGTTRES